LDAGTSYGEDGRYSCELRENGDPPFCCGDPQSTIEMAIESALIDKESKVNKKRDRNLEQT
jgi:hypothetical protein